MIGIYKITSPNKRIYVGQSNNIKSRFSQYKRLSCKGQTRLYASFNKYGVKNHKFEIITECDENQLNELERYYQEMYNCISKHGLNCQYVKTDTKKHQHSQETKDKISKSNKGKKRSEDFKKLISEQKKNITLETRIKMSISAKNKAVNKETYRKISIAQTGVSQKRYSVLNIENGIFHYSIKEASETYGFNYSCLKAKLFNQNKNNTNLIYIKPNK